MTVQTTRHNPYTPLSSTSQSPILPNPIGNEPATASASPTAREPTIAFSRGVSPDQPQPPSHFHPQASHQMQQSYHSAVAGIVRQHLDANQTLKDHYESLIEESKKILEENDSLRIQIAEVLEENNFLKAQYANAAQRVDQLYRDNRGLIASNRALSEERDSANRAVTDLQNLVGQKDLQIILLRSEIDRANAFFAGLSMSHLVQWQRTGL